MKFRLIPIILLSMATNLAYGLDKKLDKKLDKNVKQPSSGVLIITDGNFDMTINSTPYILVNFYAPWCELSGRILPHYAQAARSLKGPNANLRMAVVDVSKETKISRRLNIVEYPTFIFFRKGFRIYYYGDKTDINEIVQWALRKRQSPVKALRTVQEVREFLTANDISIIGYFRNFQSQRAQLLIAAADELDKYAFAMTDNDEIMVRHGTRDGDIVLYKPFDEGRNRLDVSLNLDHLKRVIQLYSHPYITNFHTGSTTDVFNGPVQSYLLIFHTKENFTIDQWRELHDMSKKYHDRIFFIAMNGKLNDRVMKFFDLTETKLPTVRIMAVEETCITKYKPRETTAGEVTIATIKKFIDSYLSHSLRPYRLSQRLPQDWYVRPVKILTRENFYSITQDRRRDVLVLFYAPWCPHCIDMEQAYEELACRYVNNPNVIVAKMDATANELEQVPISYFPSIKLFRSIDNRVIEYRGKRTTDEMMRFIESAGYFGQKASEVLCPQMAKNALVTTAPQGRSKDGPERRTTTGPGAKVN